MQGLPQRYVNHMTQTACNSSTEVAPGTGVTAGATMMQVFANVQDVYLMPGATATSTSPIVITAGSYVWLPVGPGYYAIAGTSGGLVSAVWWGG